MKIAYLNCSNGVAGDMILSAFINLGVSVAEIENALKIALKINGWDLDVSTNSYFHFPVTTLHITENTGFKSPEHMRNTISKSNLSPKTKKLSLNIFDRLVEAESRVHKVPLKGVHFHELNSIDTLADIIGACLCLELLKIDKVYSSPLNLGSPNPATLEILKASKAPAFSSNYANELTTPTGAAIISEISSGFGEMPKMKIDKFGFGCGTNKTAAGYSLLKLVTGTSVSASQYDQDEVVLLETNIDDMDPRIYPYVMDLLFEAGAKDVWYTQVLMKKGRPGIVLSAICGAEDEKALVDILFNETTTLGIRRQPAPRYLLERKIAGEKKTAYLPKGKKKIKSEFEIIKRKAMDAHLPLGKLLY